jgi:hypothetical protein
MLYDGCRVVYTGADDGPLRMDDQGAVMVLGERSAHVQWRTGSLAGQISLVDSRDLLPVEARRGAVEAALDDSLEVAGLGVFTARQIYDEGGAEGLLNAMVDAGHLASFTTIAEEALALVTGRLRASAALHGVTSHLEEAEAEDVVRTAAAALIRDAFSVD